MNDFTIEVKKERLKELVSFMVQGFNDCACCPLSLNCPRNDTIGIDVQECTKEIILNYLQ